MESDVHFVEFRLRTTSNLLRPELDELLLQLIELLLQLILVLAPELAGFYFAGRLCANTVSVPLCSATVSLTGVAPTIVFVSSSYYSSYVMGLAVKEWLWVGNGGEVAVAGRVLGCGAKLMFAVHACQELRDGSGRRGMSGRPEKQRRR